MKVKSRNQVISYLILLLWLAIRISAAGVVLIHDNNSAITSTSDPLSNWNIALYGLILFGSFAMIAVVIALNRDDLQRLNMDVWYLILLLIAGIVGLYELPYNCFSGIAVIYLLYVLLSKKIKPGFPDRSAFPISLWVVGIFAVTFLLISRFLDVPKIEQNIQYFVLEIVPGSIFEEAMFRGLLFMFLKDLGLSESKFLYIQAFLYWISHIDYFFQAPIWFWIFLPAMGLTLGYIVLRTKSIGLSAVAHVLINIVSVFSSLSGIL
jgi:membrane protease YdiL (CAAX protease family)